MPRWLRWSVLALLSWGVWAIMAKLIGAALSGAHNQALSTIGILPIMLAIGFSKRVFAPGNRRRGILYALAAGAVSCLGNVVYYDALSRGSKAAMIVPLTALYPLTTILLAMLLLQERLNRIQLAGVLISLAAIYLFNVQREEGFFSRWLMYALLPIVLWGAAGFLQKLSTNLAEMKIALECAAATGLPAVATMSFRPLITQCTDGHTPAACAKVMADCGAIAVGANCEQEPARMLPLLREMRAATSVPLAAQPAAFHTTEQCHSFTRLPAFPDDLETIQVSRREFLDFGKAAKQEGIGFLGGCCGCNAAYIQALKDGLEEAK